MRKRYIVDVDEDLRMPNRHRVKAYFPETLRWMWHARYSSWWISDDEVFGFSKKDYENKAKILRDTGINTVITFGGFHSRWTWHHLWPRLLEVLSSIVEACHKCDIKVVEHHSATLIAHYTDPQEIEALKAQMWKTHIDLKRHPQYLNNISNDIIVEGVNTSSLQQIDIRTGKSSQSYYHGFILCPNNPEFQRLYFQHLEDVYACGVDGIMTDDVQFMPEAYSCGCQWCRQLFKESTGHLLPKNGFDDKQFFNNFGNPEFRAFINFRIRSCADHHRRINDHFQKLGYSLARPNYSSGDTNVFGPVGTGLSLEDSMPYFNTAFTEVCSVENQLTCWSWLTMEFKHRSALGRVYDVPAMTLFYPRNSSQGYFCWAFTKLLGQNLWNTRWGATPREEARLSAKGNAFQETHPELFERPQSRSRIALFFSRRTRTNYQPVPGVDSYVYEYAGWCQQLFLNNLFFDVVLEEDLENGLNSREYDLLILPNAACLSDRQIDNVKMFVEEGGKLIASFEAGHFDQTGARRDRPAFEELFGVEDEGVVYSHDLWKQPDASRFFEGLEPYIDNRRPYRRIKAAPSSDILLKTIQTPVCVRHGHGSGEAVYFAGYVGNQANVTRPIWPWERTNRHDVNKRWYGFNKSEPEMVKLLIQSVEKLLADRLILTTSQVPCGTLFGLYKHKRFHALHILNAAKTLRKHGESFGQEGVWRTSPLGEIAIRLREIPFQKASLFSPDFTQSCGIHVENQNRCATVKIPCDAVRFYSVLKLE